MGEREWSIGKWREAIATHLRSRHPHVELTQVNRAVRWIILHHLTRHLCQVRHIPFRADLVLPIDPVLQGLVSDGEIGDDIPNLPVSLETLGQVYEILISQPKRNGVFYTPRVVVEDMVQQTVGARLSEHPNSSIHILDPSCGGGIFLLVAYQFLLDWFLNFYLTASKTSPISPQDVLYPIERSPHNSWRLTTDERQRILLDCLHGVDIDPDAVAVTRLGLWLIFLEDCPDWGDRPLPDLTHTIQWGNTLLVADSSPPGCPSDDSSLWNHAPTPTLLSQGFDIVIGNPPYLDSEWMTATLPHWRSYCTRCYQTARGNWDLFCVFIERALQLCKPGGLSSFIVPNKLASAEYAGRVRSLLTQENRLLRLRDYSRVPVFAAAVYPLVYVVQTDCPDPAAQVWYEQMADLERLVDSYPMPYRHYLRSPQSPWLLSRRSGKSDLWKVLEQCDRLPRLGMVAQVLGAATVGEAYSLQPLIQENNTPSHADWRLVNSGTLDRYRMLWGEKRLRYLGKTYLHPTVPQLCQENLPVRRRQQAMHPKLIVAGMSRQLECVADLTGAILAGKSTTIILTSLDLRYLLGLLNSQFMTDYFITCFGGNRLQGGYLRIGPPQLRQLPIRVPDLQNPADYLLYERMIDRVDRLLSVQAQTVYSDGVSHAAEQSLAVEIEQAINDLVYQLYGL